MVGNEPIEEKQLTWRPPPSAIGEKLLAAVEYKPLEEKDLFGLKISTRALKNLSPSEVRDLYEVFTTFDRNETGQLKSKELFLALRALGFNITEKVCADYIESEGSEVKALNFNQFLDLIIDKQASSKDHYEEILNGFNLFDYDNCGYISLENLKKACMESEMFLSETELKDMIQEADMNGDGLIDLNEFVNVMLRTNLYDLK